MATSLSSSSLLAGTTLSSPSRCAMTSPLEHRHAAKLLAPLARWFDLHKRQLPWRATNLHIRHHNPYAVLVSEFMLQQTQVNTVIPYFKRWMRRFPNVNKLAGASPDIVMKHWEGLGYYRRCRNLQISSQWIKKNGWPKDRSEMESLPGIGPYTSAAIGSIAFQWPTPALDGNVIRFLSRFHAINLTRRHQVSFMETWLQPALQVLGPSRLTQGLMEFGSLVCKKYEPACLSCPIKRDCQAYQSDRVDLFPKPKKRIKPQIKHRAVLIITRKDRILIQNPQSDGLLGNLYCFPTFNLSPRERATIPYIHRYSHIIEYIYPSRIQVDNIEINSGYRWVTLNQLSRLPLGKRDLALLGQMHKLKDPKNLSIKIISRACKNIFKK